MKGLSAEERRLLASRAVRRRRWRPMRADLLETTTVTIPIEKRFWRILDMGRALLPPR